MPRAEIELPIFLPGNNRDWTKADGLATITNDGEIHIRLRDPQAASMLVEMAQERIPLQVAFDYRASDEALEKIYSRYKKEK